VFGLSRDDAGKFLPFYIDNKIIEDDPFITIDTEGVGQIMEIGVKKEGRQTRISKSEYVVNMVEIRNQLSSATK